MLLVACSQLSLPGSVKLLADGVGFKLSEVLLPKLPSRTSPLAALAQLMLPPDWARGTPELCAARLPAVLAGLLL